MLSKPLQYAATSRCHPFSTTRPVLYSAIVCRRSNSSNRSSSSSSSSSGDSSTSSVLQQQRNRRLAGRRRFYRNVGFERLAPGQTPWHMVTRGSDDNTDGSSNTSNHETVQSPISAGVDGSDSASGVHHLQQVVGSAASLNEEDYPTLRSSRDSLEHYLTPRKPWLGRPADESQESSGTVSSSDLCWYGITLDGRLIQTPLGQTLMVPSELWAAQIAAEWDSVESILQPAQMPCMTLTCTILDQTAPHPQSYQDQLIRFVPTDTVCYWADPTEDRVLHQRQEQAWRRIHDRVHQVTGIRLATVSGTQEGMMTAARGLPHDPRLVEYARSFCHSLDAWHLTVLQTLAVEAKSFWLAWALLTQQHYYHAESNDDDKNDLSSLLLFREVADAVHASRVEEEFQISNWGLVEGQHDYDRLNTSINVSAALLLANSLAIDCNL